MAGCGCQAESANLERRTLRILLALNGVMFFVEGVTGWISESTGLLADSLDMLADAVVYGTALLATGRAQASKVRSAKVSGVVQMSLGFGVMFEAVRRMIFGSEPISTWMIVVGLAAFLVNVSCLCLLAKHREGEVHMRASWIFSTNDVIANVGLIFSGILVMFSGSRLPDLFIGIAVSIFVIRGGRRILREARHANGCVVPPAFK